MRRSDIAAMDPHPAFRPQREDRETLPWDAPARGDDEPDLFDAPAPPAMPAVEPASVEIDVNAYVRRPAPVASRAVRPPSSRSGPIERPRRNATARTSVVQRERDIATLLRDTGPLSVEDIAARIDLGLVRCRCIVTNLYEAGALTLTKKPSGSPSGGRPVHLFGPCDELSEAEDA